MLPGVVDLFVLRPEVLDWMDFVYALVALSAGIKTVSVTPVMQEAAFRKAPWCPRADMGK